MSAPQLKGVNFQIDAKEATFFGARGVRLSDSRWAINARGSVLAEVTPDSMLPEIRDCIKGDVDKGDEHKIAMVQLMPRQAVVFFLEGGLAREHFTNVNEGPNYIDVPKVKVEGRTVTVRIVQDAEFEVATLDAKGDVI